jgi:hypothetical protein
MVTDSVLRDLFPEADHLGVIAICKDASVRKVVGKKIARPMNSRVFVGPCVKRIASQAMY